MGADRERLTDSLYQDLPSKSSQFGTPRPTVMDSNFHESNEAHPDNYPIWLPLLNSTHHREYRSL